MAARTPAKVGKFVVFSPQNLPVDGEQVAACRPPATNPAKSKKKKKPKGPRFPVVLAPVAAEASPSTGKEPEEPTESEEAPKAVVDGDGPPDETESTFESVDAEEAAAAKAEGAPSASGDKDEEERKEQKVREEQERLFDEAVLRVFTAWREKQAWIPSAAELEHPDLAWLRTLKYSPSVDFFHLPTVPRDRIEKVIELARSLELKHHFKGRNETRHVVIKRHRRNVSAANRARDLRDVFYFCILKLLERWRDGLSIDVAAVVEEVRVMQEQESSGQALLDAPMLPPEITEALFQEGEDSVNFPTGLTPFQRRQVHSAALELDLFHASRGIGSERHVIVSREIIPMETTNGVNGEDLPSHSPVPSLSHRLTKWYNAHAVKPTLKPMYSLPEERLAALRNLQSLVLEAPQNFIPSSEKELTDLSYLPAISLSKAPEAQGVQLVQDRAAFDAMMAVLRTQTIVAFDVEAHSYRTYHGVTCLLQLATVDGKMYIVDVLVSEVWEAMPEMQDIFAEPGILKIAHSVAGCDVPSLYRDFGLYILNLFDTYEAAKALALSDVGLAGLVREFRGDSIDLLEHGKKEFQGFDWRTRPIGADMLLYASQDVYYLIPLYKLLRQRLLGYSPTVAPGRVDGSPASVLAVPAGEGEDGLDGQDVEWGTNWAEEGFEADAFTHQRRGASSSKKRSSEKGAEVEAAFDLDFEVVDDDDDDEDDELWDGWGEESGGTSEAANGEQTSLAADKQHVPLPEGPLPDTFAETETNEGTDAFSPPKHVLPPRRTVDERAESFSGHLSQPHGAGGHGAESSNDATAPRPSDGTQQMGVLPEDPLQPPSADRARSVTLEEAPQEGLDTLVMVLQKSQRQCAKLWRPRRVTLESFKRVKEYAEVAKEWERRNDRVRQCVFKELFLWRDRVAREEDESPEYIIDNRSLVTAAKLLPRTILDALKISCPLSPFFASAPKLNEDGQEVDDALSDPRSPPGAPLAHVDRLEEMLEVILHALKSCEDGGGDAGAAPDQQGEMGDLRGAGDLQPAAEGAIETKTTEPFSRGPGALPLGTPLQQQTPKGGEDEERGHEKAMEIAVGVAVFSAVVATAWYAFQRFRRRR
mmetsp:Transcript_6005/g.23322  ORF Transcript_6005/g.23322 Transcript_6005/m.23322 type:complete len:1099 (-) Transcript_6005:4-3300(-)